MRYTINQLLTELGGVLPLLNGEEHRRLVLRTVRRTLRKIGYQITAPTICVPISVIDHYVNVPEMLLEVDDVGPECGRMCGELLTDGMYSNNPFAYSDNPDGLYFPNLRGGTVVLSARMLPMDDEGQPTIDEEAYEACMAMSKAALIPLFPNHPLFGDRYTLENSARGLVDETRASYNKRNKRAKQRTMRRHW